FLLIILGQKEMQGANLNIPLCPKYYHPGGGFAPPKNRISSSARLLFRHPENYFSYISYYFIVYKKVLLPGIISILQYLREDLHLQKLDFESNASTISPLRLSFLSIVKLSLILRIINLCGITRKISVFKKKIIYICMMI